MKIVISSIREISPFLPTMPSFLKGEEGFMVKDLYSEGGVFC